MNLSWCPWLGLEAFSEKLRGSNGEGVRLVNGYGFWLERDLKGDWRVFFSVV